MIVLQAKWPFLMRKVVVFSFGEFDQIKTDSLSRSERERIQALDNAHLREDLEGQRGLAAATNYRLVRQPGEPWPEYTRRQDEALRALKDSPGLLALLDVLDGQERQAITLLAEARSDDVTRAQGAVEAIREFRQRTIAKVYGLGEATQRAKERQSRADVLRLMELDEERLADLERNRHQSLEAARAAR